MAGSCGTLQELEEKGDNTKNVGKKGGHKMLKWYRHVVRMDDNRWPMRIMPGDRKKEDDEDERK